MQVLSLVGGCGFVLAISAAFFGGTLGLLKVGRPDFLDLLLWAIFLIWQLAPILFEGYSPGLNFREVARYPVSFRTYFLLNSAYGFSDPAAITATVWLFSMWLGIVAGRPQWALPAALAFLLFGIFNLLLNRIVISLFERFQSSRKGRERMVLLTLVIMLLPQFLQFATGNFSNVRVLKVPAWVVSVLMPLRVMSPPGVTAQIFEFTGSAELWALAGLLLYGALAFVLLRHQLISVYQGEIYSEGFTARRELKVLPGRRFPLLDEVTSAIVEKELRYIRQSSRLLIQLIYPPIIFLLIAFNGTRKMSFAGKHEGVIAGIAVFLILSVSNMAYNIFGMDKEGFARWLLSPLPLRKVFLGKNITHGSLLFIVYLVASGVTLLLSHVSLRDFFIITAGFIAGLILQLSAGNLFSVYWPRRIELTKMSSKMASNAAGFASLLVTLPLLMLGGFIWLIAWYWKLPWVVLLLLMVVLLGSMKLYSYFLDRSVNYAFDHLEEIAGNLAE